MSPGTLSVTEGASATYTVKLRVPPTGGVKVRVSRGAAYYILNNVGGTRGVNQHLTFTTGTWNTAQAITVIVLDNDNALAGTSNISHTTVDADTAAEYDSVSKNLRVTVTDDDGAILVSRGSGALALTEGGGATYTVMLKGQLTSAVVMRVTSDDTGAVTASAVNDADITGETATVTHAVVRIATVRH